MSNLAPSRKALSERLEAIQKLNSEIEEASKPLDRLTQARAALETAEAALAALERADAERMRVWAESGEGDPPPPSDRTKALRTLADAKGQARAAESAARTFTERLDVLRRKVTGSSEEVPKLVAAILADEGMALVDEYHKHRASGLALDCRIRELGRFLDRSGFGQSGMHLRSALMEDRPEELFDRVRHPLGEFQSWKSFAQALAGDPAARYKEPAPVMLPHERKSA